MARWFGPKRLGYGVGVRSWQGWVATAIMIAAFAALRLSAPENIGLPHWTKFAGMGAVILGYAVLISLTYKSDP